MKRVFKTVGWVLLASTVLVTVGVGVVIWRLEKALPSTQEITQGNYRPPQVTRVLARDGTVLAELFTERRTVVDVALLPVHVKLAFIAAEDARFFEHQGLNYLGILRAFVVNFRSGKSRQGASTITQQVVKNTLLDAERTYTRKIREALLARRIEQELSKDQILGVYLNQIYFGHGRYGIEEAARYYFGCSAKDMSLSQAALLAGIVASPTKYSPRTSPTKAETRKRFVLHQMQAKGMLNAEQYVAALEQPTVLATAQSDTPQLAPEVVEIAKRTLKQVAGPGAMLGGYTITTTIDPKLQQFARTSVRNNLHDYDKRHGLRGPLAPPKRAPKKGSRQAPFEGTPRFEDHRVLVGQVTGADDSQQLLFVRVGTVNGVVRLEDHERYNPQKLPPSKFAPPGTLVRVSLLAAPAQDPKTPNDKTTAAVPLRLELGPQSALVALDVRTRQVLALVGNYEGIAGGLDRATQSRRQPGSTFKPIVYSYALHTKRFTPATLVDTNPVSVRGLRDRDEGDHTGQAPIRLREGLAKSVNVVAVHVAKRVGPASVVAWAKSLGISTPLGADLSLPLGAYETIPLEMANVYATFAGGGRYETPVLITRIQDGQGRDLPLPELAPSRQVMEPNEAFLITSMMTSVIDRGTGARAKVLGRPLAGKTGTTNESKDAWFVGFSTELAVAVWTGYDDAYPLGAREAGATAALPAWIAFMKEAHAQKPPTDFPRPPDLVAVSIDPATGLLAAPQQQETMIEYFLPGTQPTQIAPVEQPGEDGTSQTVAQMLAQAGANPGMAAQPSGQGANTPPTGAVGQQPAGATTSTQVPVVPPPTATTPPVVPIAPPEEAADLF